jgi:arabinan endo-1,5-alpha-L-arabinosidase
MKIPVIFLNLIVLLVPAFGLEQPITVHDPVMIYYDSTFYLFCTGTGIDCWSSPDMISWKKEKPVFDTPPEWAVKSVPGFNGHIWAPDISFHNGLFYLYYSVSAFGKNTSCIGLATNVTLDPSDPEFKWIDHGKVVQSVPNRDLWNAIDPNLIVEDNHTGWLAFGSFWGGIKMVKLNTNYTAIDSAQVWYTLSKRQRNYELDDDDAGNGAIEAPFVFKKDRYYYLFISLDYCCRGLQSNYKIAVGRAAEVKGPYYDRNGLKLTTGGGTIVCEGNDQWAGVGHNGIFTYSGSDYMVFHGYNIAQNGRPQLIIREIRWTADGWPEIIL